MWVSNDNLLRSGTDIVEILLQGRLYLLVHVYTGLQKVLEALRRWFVCWKVYTGPDKP